MEKYKSKCIVVLYVVLVIVSSCRSDDPEPDPFEEEIARLSKTWIVDGTSHVSLDDKDLTTELAGFEITINGTLSYTTNSNEIAIQPIPWPTSGNFQFQNSLIGLIRNDGLLIDISGTTKDELHLQFNFAPEFDNSSGKISAVNGAWVFIMKVK